MWHLCKRVATPSKNISGSAIMAIMAKCYLCKSVATPSKNISGSAPNCSARSTVLQT